ncbi:MAG: sialate O-acetylesterase [Akkermansia sp.]|nr:sialate O-acetylesterase [Akkermansia sp.]
MKLRLPSKLQAALIATLASAAFTTLSTGTIAVATGAALLAGQQAAAAVTTGTQTFTGGEKQYAAGTEIFDGMYLTSTMTTGTADANSMSLDNPVNIYGGNIYAGDYTVSIWVSRDSLLKGNQLLFAYSGAAPTSDAYGANAIVWNKTGEGTGTLTIGRGKLSTDYNSMASWQSGSQTTGTITLGDDDMVNFTFAVTGGAGNNGQKASLYVNGASEGDVLSYNGQMNGSASTFSLYVSTVPTYGNVSVTNEKLTTQNQILTLMGVTNMAPAPSLVWAGTSGHNTWNTAADNKNWLHDETAAAYIAGSDATFGSGDGILKTVVVGETVHARNMAVQDSYTFTMGGNAIAAAGEVSIASGKTLTLDGAGTLSAGGGITGGGNITKKGSGMLALNATVNLGTLDVQNGDVTIIGTGDSKGSITALKASQGKSVVLVNTDATISKSAQAYKGNLTIGAGSTVNSGTGDAWGYDSKNTLTIETGGVLAMGDNRWTFSNANNSLVLAGGTVTGAGDGYGALDFYNANGTVRVTENSEIGASIRLRNNTTTFDVAEGKTLTISGTINKKSNDGISGVLAKSGAGTLVLSGQTVRAHGTVLNAGTIRVAHGSALGGTVIQNGGVLEIGTTIDLGTRLTQTGGYISVLENGGLTLGGGTLAGTIQNAGTLILAGNITVNTDNAEGYTVAAEGVKTYTGGTSGFLSEDTTKYYLVRATGGSLTNNANISGVSNVTPDASGNITFTRNATGSGIYYVNDVLTYNADTMGTATGFAIAAGASLTSAGISAVTSAKALHGAGTYVAPSVSNSFTAANGYGLGAKVSLAPDWTGTVVVSGTSTSGTLIDFAHLANGTISTVEIKGLNGWTSDWNGEIEQNIKLTDVGTTLAWSNGAASRDVGHVANFSGKWSGSGTFARTGTNYMDYKFSGDISEWTGKFKMSSGNTTNLTFTGVAHVVKAQIERAAGTLNVAVDTDVQFNNAITADTFTVNAGRTATLNANTTVGGLTGAGNIASTGGGTAQYTGSITLNGTGSYVFDGAITGAHLLNKTGSGTQTINGPVTVDRFTISAGTTTFNGLVTGTATGYSGNNRRMSITGGTVYFNDGFAYSGSEDYALVTSGASTTVHFGGETVLTKRIGQASGAIVVDQGASLTTTQMANSPSNLKSNGAVTVEADATLTVNGTMWTTNLTNNGGTISTTGELRVSTLSGSGNITVGTEFNYDQNKSGQLSNLDGSYAGNITASTLQKYGSGKLTLSGVNAFTNATTLSAGTLEVAQVGSLGGQGVTTSANTSLIFNTADDGIYGGSITGTGSVTKSGLGNLVLTGANSYTGATAVNGGTLTLLGQNTLGSNISVAENATLKLTASGTPVTTGSLTLAENSNLKISGINGTRARSGAPITAATAGGGFSIAQGANITLGGAYTGTVAVDSTDNTKLVVSDVTQTGSIYHVYLLTGQSNSLGAVKDSPLNATMLAAYQAAGVQMYNANITNYGSSVTNAEANPSWVQLAPQEPGGTVQAQAYFNNLCMGPEYGFAYMMQKNGWFTTEAFKDQDKLGVILASLDGGGNQYWLKDSATYANILQHVKDGLLAAKQQGCSAVSLDGLMYLQGESNDGTGANAAATRYADFLGNLRGDLETWMAEENITGIDLVFSNNTVTGEPHLGNANRQTTATNLYNAAVSSGMLNADMNGRGHVLTNDLAVTNCDGLSVHYTGDAQLTIGARYAYAFAVQNGINVGAVRGQDDSKNLNEAGAWWMEALPDANEVVTWDISSVSAANNIAADATLTVGGIKIDEVYHNGATGMGQGSVDINGGTLSLGSSGIVLTGANLTIGSAVDARASQTWSAGSHTLTTTGTVTIAADQTLTIAEGSEYHFNVIDGSGNLSIGDGAVLGMTELDLLAHEGEIGYSDGENGYFSGEVVLVHLDGTGTVTLGTDVRGVDALATAGTIKVKDDDSSILLASVESNGHYQVRSGNVTYSTAKDIALATQIVINDMGSGAEATGATLTLDSAWTGVTTPIVVEGNGGAISIGSGVVLAESSLQTGSASVTLTGSGTFVMNEKSGDVSWPLPTGVSLAQGETGWTGIVRISGGNFKANNLGDLANGTYSTIELNGVSGWTGYSASTLALNLKLTNSGETSAWKMNAGSSSNNTYDNAPTMTLSGVISGTGNMEKVDGYSESFTFTGNISDWTGKFIQNSSDTRVSRLTFKGGASTINIGTENKTTNSKIGIAVGDGSTAFSATFTEQSNLQGVDELRVRDKATAEFQGTVNASGTAYLEGSAAVTNSGTMTLNSLTMATGATFTNTGSLTLNGTITFGSAGIVNSGDGAITLSSGSIFNLSQLQATGDGVYTLFTTADGGADVDLTRYHYTSANIVNPGEFTWIFGKDGTVTGRIARDLVWAGTSGNNTWTTDPDKQNWNEPDAAAFKQGDKSTFSGAAGDATTAVLGEDITTSQMILGVEGEAANLTVQNGEGNHYSLQVDDLVLNANSSLTIKGDATNKSYIAKVSTYAAGSTLSIENTEAHYSGDGKNLHGNLVIGDGAVFHVDATDSLDYDTSNTITVNQGGELAFGNQRWSINTDNSIVLNGGTISGAGQGSNGALDFFGTATVAVNADSEISAAIHLRANPTMNVADDATLTVSGTISGGNTITKDGAGTMKLAAATGASQSFNTLGVKSGTVEIAGTVTLAGSLDLSSSGSYTGSAVIDGTGQLTANNVWMRSASLLSLEKGGKLLTKNITITGGDGGAEVSTTSDNQAYDTNQDSFTIRNADVTVRSAIAGNTIANLLQDSTLQTGQNVTLSHAGNTLTSTTVTGNTLTVGADMLLGDVALTGGNLAVNAEATVDSLTATQNAALTVAGRLKIAENGSVQVTDATLNLAGSGIIDLSAMHLDGNSYYVKVAGSGETSNGFSVTDGSVQFVTLSGAGQVHADDSVQLLYKSSAGELNETTGKVEFSGEPDYATFTINTGSESLAEIKNLSKAGGETVQLQHIELHGGSTLNVDEETMNTSLLNPVSGGTRGIVNIAGNSVVTTDGTAKNISLTGSGVYALKDNSWNLPDSLATEGDDHWKGIVRVSNVTTKVSVTKQINGIMDTTPEGRVELMNVTAGYLGDDSSASAKSATVKAGIILTGSANDGTGTGFAITDGFSGNDQTFTGSVSGHGDLVEKFNPSGTGIAGNQGYIFRGDISGWDGSFKFETSKGAKTVTYSGNAWQVASGISQTSTNSHTLDVHYAAQHDGGMQVTGNVERKAGVTNALNLHVDQNATFTGEVKNASSFTVAEDKTATLQGEGKDRQLGNVTMEDNASLNIMNIAEAAKLSVGDVTIGAGATMGVYTGSDVSSLDEAALVIASGKTLTADNGATLNANLEMASGSNLDVSGTGGMGLLMGSSVTINPGNNLTVDGSTDVDSYLRNYFGGDTHKLYTLFEGTAGDPLELYIGSQKVENDITFTDWTKYDMDASTIYTNLQAQTYYLVYDGSNVGMVAIGLIPEPTTSTLSLLALAALAARRRRK